MAGDQHKPGGLITRGAARDLSDYQYHAMQQDSDGNIDYADTSSGDTPLGILTNDPDEIGSEAEVATAGTCKFKMSEACSIGDLLGSDGNYRGKVVTADKAMYFAVAMEEATAAGDLIEAKLVGPNYISA